MKTKKIILSLFILVLLAVSFIGCGGGGGGTSAPLLSENFSSFNVGDNFTSSSWLSDMGGALPSYQVQEAGKAIHLDFAGGIVYTGSGASSWSNYSFTYRFKVTNLSAMATVFLRFIGFTENSWSYYQVSFYDGNTVSLAKNPSNEAASYPLATGTVAYLTDQYYDVRVEVNGNNVKVYFNNSVTAAINFTDDGSTYGAAQPSGSIGISTPTGSVYFDDLVVTSL